MKRFIGLGLAAIVAGMLSLVSTSPASAYPETTCNVEVNPTVVYERATFTASGSIPEATSADAATKWTLTFRGKTHSGTGAVFAATFKAPSVDHTRTFTVTARADGPSGTCERSAVVKVLNRTSVAGPHPGGTLPNTGGPRLIWLIAGLALLLGGGGLVVQSRRKRAAVAHGGAPDHRA